MFAWQHDSTFAPCLEQKIWGGRRLKHQQQLLLFPFRGGCQKLDWWRFLENMKAFSWLCDISVGSNKCMRILYIYFLYTDTLYIHTPWIFTSLQLVRMGLYPIHILESYLSVCYLSIRTCLEISLPNLTWEFPGSGWHSSLKFGCWPQFWIRMVDQTVSSGWLGLLFWHRFNCLSR